MPYKHIITSCDTQRLWLPYAYSDIDKFIISSMILFVTITNSDIYVSYNVVVPINEKFVVVPINEKHFVVQIDEQICCSSD